jgi:vWA-MoxR associated protein middle region (VMAP-M) 2
MTAVRHLLIIASQCRSMPNLASLDPAAEALRDALCDPALGGCVAGLPDGRSLLVVGGDQTSADIRETIRAAIAHAAARRATLVLGLLGHGFIPGESSTLYLMGPDSQEEVRHSAVNVPELLLEAADGNGIAGLVGIIDTCNAGAGQPNLAELSTGARRGRTSMSVLMASAAGQPARDLRFTRELTALLRSGTFTAGLALFAEEAKAHLDGRLSGQDLATLTYVGERGGREALWLSVNNRFSEEHARRTIGPFGMAELNAALGAVDPLGRTQAGWDDAALRRLRRATVDVLARTGWDPDRTRLLRLIDDLVVALCTTAFLRSWLGQSLSTAELRRAAAALRPGPGGSLLGIPGSAFSREENVVEYLALHFPGPEESCRKWMCRFVVALAQNAGRDLGAPELLAWAERIDALVAFNDAVEHAGRRRSDQRLRLIVSLHASVAGDWPPTLDAWLLDGGELRGHEVFQNRAEPDRLGTEEALGQAVEWAESCAADLDPELRLQRIEVAAPSTLLLHWHPEEATVGPRLGVDYDVMVRWSQRLNPPSGLKWINRHAVKRLEQIGAQSGAAPVDWLARHSTHDIEVLSEHLLSDRYGRAIGLDHLPGQATELLDLLLSFSPIVLWPRTDAGFPTESQDALGKYWHALPVGFMDAYRKSWRDEPAEVVAQLRAIWDDLEWLQFCKSPPRPPLN